MSGRIPNRTRDRIIADYAAGMPGTKLAEKYGIGQASVYRIVKVSVPPPKRLTRKDRSRMRREEEFALTGGRWVLDPVRRIQRWEPAA